MSVFINKKQKMYKNWRMQITAGELDIAQRELLDNRSKWRTTITELQQAEEKVEVKKKKNCKS